MVDISRCSTYTNMHHVKLSLENMTYCGEYKQESDFPIDSFKEEQKTTNLTFKVKNEFLINDKSVVLPLLKYGDAVCNITSSCGEVSCLTNSRININVKGETFLTDISIFTIFQLYFSFADDIPESCVYEYDVVLLNLKGKEEISAGPTFRTNDHVFCEGLVYDLDGPYSFGKLASE